MKTLMLLFSAMVIAASAAAQTGQAGANAAQPPKAGLVDRQPPIKSDANEGVDPPAPVPADSANAVDPVLRGSSKQEATSSSMGQPAKDGDHGAKDNQSGSSAQDAENKTKQ